MKLAVFADLHFREDKLADTAAAWKLALGECDARGVDTIVIAGDVFDDYNIGGNQASVGTVVDAVLTPLQEWLKGGDATVFVIRGNHDMAAAGQVDALRVFDGIPNVHVIRDICETTWSPDTFLFLPWQTKAGMLGLEKYKAMSPGDAEAAYQRNLDLAIASLRRDAMAARTRGETSILVGHCTLVGSVTAKGYGLGGGDFALTTEQLEGIGADIIALGDVHKRQGFYVGALTQCNFGEEGNPTGFRLIETGEHPTDDFVEVPSPRYFTVKAEDYKPGTYQPNDYVKVRGVVVPDAPMAPNVRFERIVVPTVVQARTDAVLTAETPVADLLGVWYGLNTCPVPLPELQKKLAGIMRDVALPPEPIGSLERLNHVRLEGIGSHVKTDIDLSRMSGLIGVVGTNGSGKTFFLETIMAAAYGRYPYRTNGFRDDLRSGSMEALIEVEAVDALGEFRLRRELRQSASGKSFKHQGWVFRRRVSDGQWDPKAGPHVEDMTTAATALLGDEDLVRASVFCSQNQAGDLCDADPADRKELFAKLLGTAKLAIISKRAGDASKEVSGDLARLRSRVASLDMDLNNLPTAEETVRTMEARLCELDAELSIMEAERRGLLEEEAKLKASVGDVVAARQRLNQAQADVAAIDARLGRLASQIATCQEAQSKLPEYRKASEEYDALGKDLAVLRERLAALRKTMLDLQTEKTQVINDVAALRLEVQRKLSERKAELAGKLNEAKHRLLVDESLGREEVSKAQNAVNAQKAKVEGILHRTKLLDGGKFTADVCATCPFTADAYAAKLMLVTEIATLQDLEVAFRDKVNVSLLADWSKRREEITWLAAQLAEITAEALCPDDVAKGKALVEQEKTLLERQMKMTEEHHAYCVNISKGESRMSELYPMVKNLSGANAVAANLSMHMGEYGLAVQERAAKMVEADALFKQAEEMVNPAPALDRCHMTLEDVSRRLSAKRAERNTRSELKGSAIARVDELHQKREDRLATLEKARDKELAAGVYLALEQAFGRDGIPQLVVSSAIPHFQDILTDLLKEFDSRWAISLSTQSVTQKGVVKEALDIIVDDGKKPRDILTYSGGERKVLRTLVRIGFAALQAQRTGRRIQTFFLDEAFEALDTANSERILAVFGKLDRWFKQIFIVSHTQRQIMSLPNRLEFRLESGDQTAVTVVSA